MLWRLSAWPNAPMPTHCQADKKCESRWVRWPNAPVLLMDEPFAALDEMTRFKLDDDLRATAPTKLHHHIVTHSVTEAAYLAERAMVMAAGRVQTEISNAPRA